ncbi:MAG: hypothetical protein ACT4O2_14210 [Beijerinckiaceae bacterium]
MSAIFVGRCDGVHGGGARAIWMPAIKAFAALRAPITSPVMAAPHFSVHGPARGRQTAEHQLFAFLTTAATTLVTLCGRATPRPCQSF